MTRRPSVCHVATPVCCNRPFHWPDVGSGAPGISRRRTSCPV
jgi:hypothetical protein